jgi:autotransporter family porin
MRGSQEEIRVQAPIFSTTRGMLRRMLVLLALIVTAYGIFVRWRAVGSRPAPSSGTYFATLPPGSALPSGSDCALRVHRSSWEPRLDNDQANRTAGIACSAIGACSVWSKDLYAYASRVDGHFSGTTDEILQWGACKWGLDEDIQRARAVEESGWHQSARGDRSANRQLCSSFGASAPCYQSFGILQIKASAGEGYLDTYPYSQNSTAFNVDYSLAWLRGCFDGYDTWLNGDPKRARPYIPGDLWGCIGAWYSGKWHDSGAETYITAVERHLASKEWLKEGF